MLELKVMGEKLFSLAHISSVLRPTIFFSLFKVTSKNSETGEISICPATNGSNSAFYDLCLIETVSYLWSHSLYKLPICNSKYRKETPRQTKGPESLLVSVHRSRLLFTLGSKKLFWQQHCPPKRWSTRCCELRLT